MTPNTRLTERWKWKQTSSQVVWWYFAWNVKLAGYSILEIGYSNVQWPISNIRLTSRSLLCRTQSMSCLQSALLSPILFVHRWSLLNLFLFLCEIYAYSYWICPRYWCILEVLLGLIIHVHYPRSILWLSFALSVYVDLQVLTRMGLVISWRDRVVVSKMAPILFWPKCANSSPL